MINKAHENGVEVVLTVTLFNKTDLETLLSNENNRTTLINSLVNQVKSANGDGVNIDFEVFPASQKSNLVTFVKDLRTALRNEISHAQVTLATPAVDWSNAWILMLWQTPVMVYLLWDMTTIGKAFQPRVRWHP